MGYWDMLIEVNEYLEDHTVETVEDLNDLQSALINIWVEEEGNGIFTLYYDPYCDMQWHNDFRELITLDNIKY